MYLEADGLIRLSCKKEILPLAIRRLHPLFVSGHEAMPWLDSIHNLWVVHLVEEAVLLSIRISLLCN